MCLQFSRSSLPPNTRIISPIRIIIYRTDTFVYLNILKEHISCYYFAMFFSSLSHSTETVSNDRLYTYYILPYQPEAYEAVFLHCHSRFVTPQTGRMFCRTIALPSLNKVIVLYCNKIVALCSTCRIL